MKKKLALACVNACLQKPQALAKCKRLFTRGDAVAGRKQKRSTFKSLRRYLIGHANNVRCDRLALLQNTIFQNYWMADDTLICDVNRGRSPFSQCTS